MKATSTCAESTTGAKGFSLIELMVTVAIVAILAALAYPAYQTFVVKTHRSAAKACLAQYAQFMERYYTTNLTYVDADPSLGCAMEDGMDANYSFEVDNLGASTYIARAVPTTAFSARDTRCGTLSLTQTGARSAGSGSAADIEYCW